MKTCATCDVWRRDNNPIVGQARGVCRRYPPTPLLMPGSTGVQLNYLFPVTGPNDGCGAHVPAPPQGE